MRGRGCGVNRIPGDFRIPGNELVTDLRARDYTRRLHVGPMRGLNIDKFKNRATGYRHSRSARETLIADVAEGEGDDDVGRRCRHRPCIRLAHPCANTVFYSNRAEWKQGETKRILTDDRFPWSGNA